jgi:hypothetical protein
MSYSAAVSIILGSKLHESRRELTMVSRKKDQINIVKFILDLTVTQTSVA